MFPVANLMFIFHYVIPLNPTCTDHL